MNARPSDWPHLFALFERIAEAAPGERSGLLDEATRDRPDLRAHLQRLLELDASGSDLAADVAGWRERLAGLAAETPMPERVGAWKIVRELGVERILLGSWLPETDPDLVYLQVERAAGLGNALREVLRDNAARVLEGLPPLHQPRAKSR